MSFKVHLRVSPVPAIVVLVSLAAIVSVLWVPKVKPVLAAQVAMLPWLVLGTGAALTLAFIAWYSLSYAAVRRNYLVVRSATSRRRSALDLRRLTAAEVISSGRQQFSLVLRLEDDEGRQLHLPLNTWRDEDLLVARVLRATVDRRVVIEGDPRHVQRFSGLLDTYKSWDRRQAAA